jgi:hypothetical protein
VKGRYDVDNLSMEGRIPLALHLEGSEDTFSIGI